VQLFGFDDCAIDKATIAEFYGLAHDEASPPRDCWRSAAAAIGCSVKWVSTGLAAQQFDVVNTSAVEGDLIRLLTYFTSCCLRAGA
jgi:hypothetical protein